MGRATSSVVGIVLLVAITVIGAATVGLALDTTPTASPELASFELAADAETNSLSITHRGGDPIDLTETQLQVEIDGESLDTNPPIPFFAAKGFVSGPSGPFNRASPDTWRPGETGRVQIATTNDPQLRPDSTVTVRIISDGTEIAELTDTA
jgi:FlaG/FlaF family flagellin (archaellin)